MNRTPEDPRIAHLVRLMSRRRVLQLGGLAGVGAVAAACGSGIGGSTASTSATPAPTNTDISDKEKIMNWSTWIDYIDVDKAGHRPTLDRFHRETGILVNYNEDYNDNNEFYAKVRTQLENGQPIGRDLITATDWMANIWIRKGYAQRIDLANVPNHANIGETWMNVAFDPTRAFTMPWMSGFAGLGWNKKLLLKATGKTEIKTLDDLWDPRLKGRVTILSEMRDTIGVTLMAMGKRADKFTDADFQAAIDLLQKKVDDGTIRQVTGNDYKTAMAAGEVIAAIAWSGDMLNDTNTYGFNIPESGGTLWTDNMLIPVLAAHKKNAEAWMNFYYQPDVAATVAAYVQYISPVKGAQDAMKKIDPTQVNNPAIFPDQKTLASVQVFMPLTDVQQASYSQQFAKLSGA
ncbi:MAG: polyamine ABC transporter substrate-binding protein [Candidatus Nanopelagicales bacterium]